MNRYLRSSNVYISQNTATDAEAGGGGVYVYSNTTTFVSGCTVTSNTAAWDGGGEGVCYNAAASVILNYDLNTIDDTVICENS